MEANTGAILYKKNPDLRLPPASTTKVMTAIVALENSSLNSLACASKAATRVQPCKIKVRPGEKWRLEDLLRCVLLNSANDASVVIAEGCSGSVANFTRLMNLRAKQIGATNTNFSNPHGLDQRNHYSTARDLATIFKYAMNNNTFREIIQTESMSIRGPGNRLIYLRNHNKLLGTFEGMVGGKTGYTRQAKKCFVGIAERNGKNLLVCVLGSKNHFLDVARLLDFGFNGDGTDRENATLKMVQATEISREETNFSLGLNPSHQGSYVLQVASFCDMGNALGLNQTLSNNGYPSFIEETSLKNGDIRHRVKVGYYQDLSSAKKTKECIWKYLGINPIILRQGTRIFP